MEQSNMSYDEILQLARQAGAEENYPALKLYLKKIDEFEHVKTLKDTISKNCMSNENSTNIINRGTGAGGSNTNANGLPYEDLTDLKTEYKIVEHHANHNEIQFKDSDIIFKSCSQAGVFKCMNGSIDVSVSSAHGCKRPDECFINEEQKKIYIIEKKFQQGSGSVCEKIQTSEFKKWQYNRLFPDYEIFYIYCLSDWFKSNTPAELEYLEYKNVPVFWGSDSNYKKQIIDFIINA